MCDIKSVASFRRRNIAGWLRAQTLELDNEVSILYFITWYL